MTVAGLPVSHAVFRKHSAPSSSNPSEREEYHGKPHLGVPARCGTPRLPHRQSPASSPTWVHTQLALMNFHKRQVLCFGKRIIFVSPTKFTFRQFRCFFANLTTPSGVSYSPSGISYSPVSTFASLRQSS